MSEHLRENYFLVLRMIITLVLEVYIILDTNILTEASYLVLLFSACLIFAITLNGFYEKNWFFLGLEGVFLLLLIFICNPQFVLLLAILILDIVSFFNLSLIWYLTTYATLLVTDKDLLGTYLLIISLLFVVYFQHRIVIRSYREKIAIEEISELKLRKDLHKKENDYQNVIKKSLITAENSILEEKARLSQALHDKLGHSINGSVYQLEACKVLLEKDIKSCKNILQLTIDNLRKSMDEIREILRRERPDKYRLALIQLESLCDDCRNMGIDAKVHTTGNISSIPDKYLEIILDNAVESVSNSLKYAKCTKIDIEIISMNQFIRCTITDNGIGCGEIIDGMGLSGMRKRMRSVNGILDFESEIGFLVNMLFPLERES